MDLGNAETVDPSHAPADRADGGSSSTTISTARAQYAWGGNAPRQLSLLAQVAEQTASAVLVTDVNGIIVWVNEGFSRITGYGFDESVGRRPGELLQGVATDPDEAARFYAALRAKQGVSAELLSYAKDGRQYWVGIKLVPLVNAAGEVDAFMATAADITERRARNQALELLSTRFDMATRTAGIGIFDLDTRTGEDWWSPMVWQIFGMAPGSASASWDTWQTCVHPDD
jgi:PAS domain S-box-containing protein